MKIKSVWEKFGVPVFLAVGFAIATWLVVGEHLKQPPMTVGISMAITFLGFLFLYMYRINKIIKSKLNAWILKQLKCSADISYGPIDLQLNSMNDLDNFMAEMNGLLSDNTQRSLQAQAAVSGVYFATKESLAKFKQIVDSITTNHASPIEDSMVLELEGILLELGKNIAELYKLRETLVK